MIQLWVTLLVLQRGYTLVPVTTVELGEAATFRCALPKILNSRRKVQWYKQSAGDNLKLIFTHLRSGQPEYAAEFPETRFQANSDDNFSNLTILSTIQEDEGLYHCAITEWIMNTIWNGTYLLVKGNTQRTSNYTVVQQSTVSDPGHPGGSRSLQCSVLSDSENETCPGDHSVFWFRVGSDKSHPNILYTDGNRRDECEEGSDPQKSCVYHFSKSVSSSDDGTYYCAVATCGEILFGNGDEIQTEQTKQSFDFIALVIVTACLLISMIGNIVLVCNRTSRPTCEQFREIENTTAEARHEKPSQPVHDTTRGGDDVNYAALRLTGRRATSRRKNNELTCEDSVYAQVKC